MQLSNFDIISIAYQARLLFSTDKEFRATLGVSWESVKDNRDDSMAIDTYYDRLDAKCREVTGDPLDDTVKGFVKASEIYQSLDWGDRRDIRARKKFCRLIFRMAATAGRRMTVEEEEKFRWCDDDRRLTETFFPDGWEGDSSVNILFIVLFTFGIVRPYNPGGKGNTRSHDTDTAKITGALEDLLNLLKLLKEDMPRIGTLSKPMAFDQWIGIITGKMAEGSIIDCTPLWRMHVLDDVVAGCLSVVVPELTKFMSESLISLRMPGIWIDDADKGENRFWIFPMNMPAAFCFKKEGEAWELMPYEFVCSATDDRDLAGSCCLVSPKGNMRLFSSPQNSIDGELAWLGMELQTSEESGELIHIDFFENGMSVPAWVDWRSMTRLDREDELHAKFMTVIDEIYDERSPLSRLYRNHAKLVTDVMNNLLGRDRDYLYLADYPVPDRWMVRRADDESFIYDFIYTGKQPDLSFIGLEISEHHPLYAIPIKNSIPKSGSFGLQRLARVIENSEEITSICLIHLDSSHRKIIFFRDFAIGFDLDGEEMKILGIRKFTSREEFWKK